MEQLTARMDVTAHLQNPAIDKTFNRNLMGLCLLYLACQVVYLATAAFTADDFWLAFHTYQFKSELPYRDFAPYKTVLGYYVLLLPMLFTHGVLQPLLAVKFFYAFLNSVFLWLSGSYLKKFFAPTAVLVGLALLVFSQIFLSYSSEIRVDVMAYWLCLLSLLFILDNKFILAGIGLGVAFLISQKALCYLLAVNCGVLLTDPKGKWRELLVMNAIVSALIVSYILIWSGFANLYAVMKSVFYDAYVISALDNYEQTRLLFLKLFILNNFLLAVMIPLACLGLLVPTEQVSRQTRYFILLVALIVIVSVLNYKQAFNYNKLILLPVLALVFPAFFTWLLSVFNYPLRTVMLPLLLCVGAAIPTVRFFVLADNGEYQKSMLKLADTLLAENENYLAGTPVFYDKPLTVRGLRHLTAPALEWLYEPTEKLRNGLLPALLLDPVSVPGVLQALQTAPVKLYINNNRMQALPPTIQQYLATQYQHFWGSIYLYAPLITADKTPFMVKFNGDYQIESMAPIVMDGKKLAPGAIISITQGRHLFQTATPFRLHLIPHGVKLDARFGNDEYARMLS